MELDVMLCDHAQVSGSKLFISGANINRVTVAASAMPPFPVTLAVAGLIHVPWNSTNTEHTVAMALLDEDGQPARVPEGVAGTIGGEFTFNVGRPAQLAAGDSQIVPFAYNFAGIPLMQRGRYGFAITLNGTTLRSVPFTVD